MSQNVIPFATYRPIAWAEARDDATNPTCVILHLTASEATSQHGYFSNPANRACSNTHVARDGHVEQYIRGDRLSAADSYGSSRAFSVETQGADANGRWTPEQCESIARILAWAHQTYGIPLRLMTSSATSERGIGWHRLGCDGNFPSMPNILAGRLQRGGGEVWSSAFGKVCPGDNRIKQIPAILERAIAITAGADTDPGGFMSDLTEEQQKAVLKATTAKVKDGDRWLEPHDADRVEIELLRRIERTSGARDAAERQRDADQRAQIAGLTAAVTAMAEAQNLPVEATLEAIREAIKGITITVASKEN